MFYFYFYFSFIEQNYRFSPEELRVIAECESEAFRYRSLPWSFGLGTATLLAVKNGIFRVRKKEPEIFDGIFSELLI